MNNCSNFSKVTIICKNLNQNSVLFVSSDLLGESQILIENLQNLKKYCETGCTSTTIVPYDNSQSYRNSWISRYRNDSSFIDFKI